MEETKNEIGLGAWRLRPRAIRQLAAVDEWLLVSASRPPTLWSSEVSPPAGGRAAMMMSDEELRREVRSAAERFEERFMSLSMFIYMWLRFQALPRFSCVVERPES